MEGIRQVGEGKGAIEASDSRETGNSFNTEVTYAVAYAACYG